MNAPHVLSLIAITLFTLPTLGQALHQQEMEGTYNVLFLDTFDEHAQALPILQQSNGQIVYLDGPSASVNPGERVRITGQYNGVDTFEIDQFEVLPSLSKKPRTEGAVRVAIFLVNFQNNTSEPYTKEALERSYFDDRLSVGAYINEVSYGKAWLEGDIFDDDGSWYTLPVDAPPSGGCTSHSFIEELLPLVDEDVTWFDENNEQRYDRVVITFPYLNCGWGGAAIYSTLSFESPQGTLELGFVWMNGSTNTATLAHEQLHNYGLGHANAWRHCLEGFYQGPGCYSHEYGFLDDVMASGKGEINAHMKQYLGWLDNVEEVTTSGAYTLHLIEEPSDQTQALTIQRDPISRYILELRTGDSELRPAIAEPYVALNSYHPGTAFERYSQVSLKNGGSNLQDYKLYAGDQITDSFAGFTITIDQIEDNKATVSIDLNTPKLFPTLELHELSEPILQENPQLWGERLVWEEYETPDTWRKIYACNLDANERCEKTLVADSEDWHNKDPDVWGDYAVWADFRTGDGDIYAYDLANETEIPLIVDPAPQATPAISENLIVWADQRNGNWDIFACEYQPESDTCLNEHAITTDESDQTQPDVSEHVIVWRDERADDGDIMYCEYNVADGTCEPTLIDHLPGVQVQPVVSGRHIVWQYCASNNPCNNGEKLYVMDRTSGEINPVEHRASGVAQTPVRDTAISDGVIVWRQGHRLMISDLHNDFTAVLGGRITFQKHPTISDGQIVWVEHGIAGLFPKILSFDYGAFREAYFGSQVGTTDQPTALNFHVAPNFPNPAGSSTTLVFTLAHPSPVSIDVFDILGRAVLQPIHAQYHPAGTHLVNLDTSALGSGVYFYRITAGTHNESRKLVIVGN